jgi:hypothetical protein
VLFCIGINPKGLMVIRVEYSNVGIKEPFRFKGDLEQSLDWELMQNLLR